MNLENILETIFEMKKDPKKEDTQNIPKRKFPEGKSSREENAEKHAREGIIQYGKGKYREALKSFKNATKIDPNHGFYWIDTGNTYRKLNETEEAIKSYEEALKQTLEKPEKQTLLRRLGDLYFKKKQFRKAAKYYSQLDFKNYIISYEARVKYSYCCIVLEDYKTAIKYAKEAAIMRSSQDLPKELINEASKRKNN